MPRKGLKKEKNIKGYLFDSFAQVLSEYADKSSYGFSKFSHYEPATLDNP
jgi:hypothetical protein